MPDTDESEEENIPSALISMFTRHRRGIALSLCTELFMEAVEATVDTGGKSELTIKITIAKEADEKVNIQIQPTSKLPKEKLPGSSFWRAGGGALVDSDPRQMTFKLREAAPAKKELREAVARHA